MISAPSGRTKARGSGRNLREAEMRALLSNRKTLSLLALSVVVLVAAITKPPSFTRRSIGYDIDNQSVAIEEVRAEIYFQAEDLQTTKQKRDEAAAKVPDTYRVDREHVQLQLRQLQERIETLSEQRDEVDAVIRDALLASDVSRTEYDVVTKALLEYATRLKEDPLYQEFPDASMLAIWLAPAAKCIPKRRFAELQQEAPERAHPLPATGLEAPDSAPLTFAYGNELAKLAREGLEATLKFGVIKPGPRTDPAQPDVVILREDPLPDQKASEELPLARVPTPKDAEALMAVKMAELAKAMSARDTETSVDWTLLEHAAFAMAQPFVTDTLFFDRVYTEAAREQARAAMPPQLKEVQPGEVIQRSGDRWTAQKRSDVKTYWGALMQQRKPGTRLFTTLAAHVVFVGLILVCLVRCTLLLSAKPENVRRNLNLSLLLLGSTAVVGRVASYFEPSGFVLPVTSGVILMAILVNARIAVMFGFLTAVLVSIQFGYDWRLLVVSGTMSMAGVFGTRTVRKRSDMTGASLKATAAGILAMVAITLAMDSLASGPALRRLVLVLLNGGVCLFIIPGVLSPLERLFKITTDIQLLEYSDLNNDLLRRIAIEIPATYAHSLMLGQLAEAAADAIGANGLLARVCAYYHDVGKLSRPEYFSENQAGPNVHEDMPPRVSARAIARHVSYGVQLAQEFHLPEPIVAAIVEHHGTCLISFFYQQALEQHRHDEVAESDFRYSGPKPQSRETAILMICDAVESGVRTIKNPNEDRIREFVDKIVTARFSDRQFDECPITLKDLDTIKDVVTKRMLSALHPRVSYPSFEKRGGSNDAGANP